MPFQPRHDLVIALIEFDHECRQAAYEAYLPGYWAFGWSGRWDTLPAVHATSILWDVLTLVGLWLVGLRLGGSRLAAVLDMRPARIRARLVSCGEDDSVVGVCWNGSPYQPVPIAADVGKAVALRILEQPEDYPAVLAEQQSVRSYPRPYGVNLAHVLGYLSPITAEEYDAAQRAGDTSVNGASVVGRENSRHRNRPPGFSTRRASRSAAEMSVTLRMPKLIT